MSSKPFTARFSSDLVSRLTERSAREAMSRAKLAERYIEEGLRMDSHPGIVFRDGPAGRRAGLLGGLEVWEMIAIVLDQPVKGEPAITETAEYLDVSPTMVRTAVLYYGEYTDEIDAIIAHNQELTDAHETAWRESIAAIS